MPPYGGKNVKLIEIDGTPLPDDDVGMDDVEEVALPESDNDLDDDTPPQPPTPRPSPRWSTIGNDDAPHTRTAKKFQLKKKQPQKKVTQQMLNTRIYRKRQNVNEPEDDLETPEKYSRGTGTKYFYSWD